MSQSHKKVSCKRVGLLLVGGEHHILHLVPIAAGLHEREAFQVIVYVTGPEEKIACERVLEGLGVKGAEVKLLKARGPFKTLSRKLGFLFSHVKVWEALDAMIVVERTSTILRYLSRKLPPLIHIPHGAGDRAKSYDARIRHFDYVLVAGDKDKKRMLELGLLRHDNCHVTGYIKPYAVEQLRPDPLDLFADEKPVVLYNPHFDARLSSWPQYGYKLLEVFAHHTDFNFIFAPHVRLFAGARPVDRARVMAFERYKNIHVDLGSARSNDMSYTRAADIYLGDVSSQVYEFLSKPKPCLFIGDEAVDWQDNPDYAHWLFGPVCHSVEGVMRELDEAENRLQDYVNIQKDACLAAKGCPEWNPIERAADTIAAIFHRD